MTDDPGFASAVERAYLRALGEVTDDDDREPILSIHESLMESAIVRADHANGGLRFKALPNRGEIEERLLRALRRKLLG